MYNYKSILRLAASRTRELLLAEEFNSSSFDCILTTCSRAVFTDNVTLASHLIRRYSIAREHLYIRNNSVHMHSAERLSLEISRARHRALERRVRDTESHARALRPNSPRFNSCQNKIRFLSNIMRQWITFCIFDDFSHCQRSWSDPCWKSPPNPGLVGQTLGPFPGW